MGFLAFLLPRTLQKTVEITEMILLPFKIHCKAGRRGTRDALGIHKEKGAEGWKETIETRVPERDKQHLTA